MYLFTYLKKSQNKNKEVKAKNEAYMHCFSNVLRKFTVIVSPSRMLDCSRYAYFEPIYCRWTH